MNIINDIVFNHDFSTEEKMSIMKSNYFELHEYFFAMKVLLVGIIVQKVLEKCEEIKC